MRLLQINHLYSPVGGSETYLLTVLPALQQAGIDVAIMYCLKTGKEVISKQWPEIYLPALWRESPLSMEKRKELIGAEITRFNPDLIQINSFDEPEIVAWLAELRPTIQMAHAQYPFSCPGDSKFLPRSHDVCTRAVTPFCLIAPFLQNCGSWRFWLHWPRYQRTKAYLQGIASLRSIIVASHYMQKEFLLNGIEGGKVIVVPLPVKLGAMVTIETTPVNKPLPIVLFDGRLTAQKGGELLLAALKQITIACHLVVVGDGPQKAMLERMAQSLPRGHKVTFTGWLDSEDLTTWYQRARLVAVPSAWAEPFGLMGLEAMAQAKPVVAFDRGGIEEWLKDGVNGLMVQAKDINGLARALEQLLFDQELAKNMGLAGYRMVAEQFSLAQHVATLQKIYQQALS